MNLVIIDYGAGNIQSIRFALSRLGCGAVLSDDPSVIAAADKVIFPGVGEAGSAMAKLKTSGLDALIPQLKQPVLGICLGMQLMCDATEEGQTTGLGIFRTRVLRFRNGLKVPQIGWNRIKNLDSALFSGIREKEYMYLLHSYYAENCGDTIAETEYGISYSAALQRENYYGLQFHPEKSGEAGARILRNFLKL